MLAALRRDGGRLVGRAENAFRVHFETGKGEGGVHLHAKRLITLRVLKISLGPHSLPDERDHSDTVPPLVLAGREGIMEAMALRQFRRRVIHLRDTKKMADLAAG